MSIQVLYEDNHLLAAVKPAGVLAQGDKTGDTSMLDEVGQYLKEKYNKPGNAFVGLLHRLDRPVCGIMLFAKTSKGASRLSEQFRNHEIVKIYHALVAGKPKEERGFLEGNLEKLKTQKASLKATTKNAKPVALYYELVKSGTRYSLLKVRLGTGKFHQIRAQLSAAGTPIVGDVKYGGPAWDDPKAIALCATGLHFTTATDGRAVDLALPIPGKWNNYLG